MDLINVLARDRNHCLPDFSYWINNKNQKTMMFTGKRSGHQVENMQNRNILAQSQINPHDASTVYNLNDQDIYYFIRKSKVNVKEFHNLCQLFAHDKNPNCIAVWMTYYGILKNDQSEYVKDCIISIPDNNLTRFQLAYFYTFHCLNGGRFNEFDEMVKTLIIDENENVPYNYGHMGSKKTFTIHASHFLYEYEKLVDPLNEGSDSYESFLFNNRNNKSAWFHVISYLGRVYGTIPENPLEFLENKQKQRLLS